MESVSKGKLKWLRSLKLEKNRRREKRFIVYGEKMIAELYTENPDLIEFITSTDDELCEKFVCSKISERDMKSISELKTPGKLLAVVKEPEISAARGDLILVLDGVRDPGNLGTIIRTAEWFGVNTIFCSRDTVSFTNPKVVQASMGSVFRVAVQYGDLTELLGNKDRKIYGALLDGKEIEREFIRLPAYLVIGSEGSGISDPVRELIDEPIKIPSFGKAESLNASVACGILLAAFRMR